MKRLLLPWLFSFVLALGVPLVAVHSIGVAETTYTWHLTFHNKSDKCAWVTLRSYTGATDLGKANVPAGATHNFTGNAVKSVKVRAEVYRAGCDENAGWVGDRSDYIPRDRASELSLHNNGPSSFIIR
jgi:hypothetical protein